MPKEHKLRRVQQLVRARNTREAEVARKQRAVLATKMILGKWSNPQLRQRCGQYGVSAAGRQHEMVDRLIAAGFEITEAELQDEAARAEAERRAQTEAEAERRAAEVAEEQAELKRLVAEAERRQQQLETEKAEREAAKAAADGRSQAGLGGAARPAAAGGAALRAVRMRRVRRAWTSLPALPCD